jgi:hypothetical protein
LNCFLMTIKNRLRKIRHELKIDKQIEMARLLGLRQEQYNIYELQRSNRIGKFRQKKSPFVKTDYDPLGSKLVSVVLVSKTILLTGIC